MSHHQVHSDLFVYFIIGHNYEFLFFSMLCETRSKNESSNANDRGDIQSDVGLQVDFLWVTLAPGRCGANCLSGNQSAYIRTYRAGSIKESARTRRKRENTNRNFHGSIAMTDLLLQKTYATSRITPLRLRSTL